MTIANIIIGLIFGAAGAAFIIYAYPLNKKVLFLSWVEKKWGMGTGPTAYKMLGLLCIIAGVCAIIGWLDLATPILGSFKGDPKPTQVQNLNNSPAQQVPNYRYNGNVAP
jgi:hypothetical protein